MKRILIADDQRDVLEALRILLKGEGYQTDAVTSLAFSPKSDYLTIGYKDRAEAWYVGPNDAKKNPERIYRTGVPVTAVAACCTSSRVKSAMPR